MSRECFYQSKADRLVIAGGRCETCGYDGCDQRLECHHKPAAQGTVAKQRSLEGHAAITNICRFLHGVSAGVLR